MRRPDPHGWCRGPPASSRRPGLDSHRLVGVVSPSPHHTGLGSAVTRRSDVHHRSSRPPRLVTTSLAGLVWRLLESVAMRYRRGIDEDDLPDEPSESRLRQSSFVSRYASPRRHPRGKPLRADRPLRLHGRDVSHEPLENHPLLHVSLNQNLGLGPHLGNLYLDPSRNRGPSLSRSRLVVAAVSHAVIKAYTFLRGTRMRTSKN